MRQDFDKFLATVAVLIALYGGGAAQSQGDDIEKDLAGTGIIRGRVVTESGQPLENVTVYIHTWNARQQPAVATTDSEGRFQVAGLNPMLYSVSATAPTYVPRVGGPGTQPTYRIGDTVTVTLIKGGVITGTVTSASGQPLIQIPVRATLLRDVNGQKYSGNQSERITDDRGVYRLYGVPPGTYVVSAGGRGSWSFYGNAYDTDVPTYAPSATRDTAVEINVRAGDEKSGVDIRYRAETGHVVSGTVNGPSAPTGPYFGASATLTQISNGTRFGGLRSSQAPDGRGFSIFGVGDGDYELTGLTALGPNEIAVSEPRRITVKGADVTGLELITKPLGSISGHLALENSTAPACKGKRKPLLAETLVLIQNNSKEPARDDPRIIWFTRQVTPDKSGDVLFSNLGPGQYRFDLQFSAKYWYLKSMAQPTGAAPTAVVKSTTGSRTNDAARNWINLKQGDRLSGLTFTLAEGAGSLRGSIKLAEGERVPAQLYMHLVPSEKDNAEDVLRYFAAAVNADGTFALGNLPPGRYWALARIGEDNETTLASKVRLPEESQTRIKLRSEAEASRTEIEFKPCQNITDYQWSLKPR